ncbi:MAG: hypothetical protein JXA07_11800, partial [Spirochaetes bacterium]|nr:hypothetical protein [Spirochaetota bacterium]
MNIRNLTKLALLPLLAIVFTFGLSHVGQQMNISENNIVFDISGFNKAYAGDNPTQWGGVRSAATLLRAVNQ